MSIGDYMGVQRDVWSEIKSSYGSMLEIYGQQEIYRGTGQAIRVQRDIWEYREICGSAGNTLEHQRCI